jgi:hypothetical protein
MDSKTAILKLLLGRKEEKFTIRQIAKTLKINYRTAYENVILLEKDGLISVTKAGNSKLCEFSGKFNQDVFKAEYSRRQELLRNKDFLVFHDSLTELRFPFIALLFGYHVKGNAGKHSDIDILTIGGDEREIKAAVRLLPDKIHLTSISYESFIKMAKSREFTVVSEALKNNIILIGIEEYYRLMKNAG